MAGDRPDNLPVHGDGTDRSDDTDGADDAGLTIERGDPAIAPSRVAPLTVGCGCGVLAGVAGILFLVLVAAQTLDATQGPIPEAVNWTRWVLTELPSAIARALEGGDAKGFGYTAIYGLVVFVECYLVAFVIGWLWGVARRAAAPRWAEAEHPTQAQEARDGGSAPASDGVAGDREQPPGEPPTV